MAFGDGPPYSEDEDLHSPVVSSRQKKSKSTLGISLDKARGRSPGQSNADVASSITGQETYDGDRGYFAGVNGDGSETYYVGEADESADGPGGELVTYPPDQARHSILSPNTYHSPRQRDSHFAATLPDRSYRQPSTRFDDDDIPSEPNSGSLASNRDSRYSKDYQFTIASPDEEMHGKAVALFDFARENENELPLVEGQVIWVSYRHGQGWLVAEDPKTRESGLVPEEYVRLLRDIEGDWHSLSGEAHDERNVLSPAEPDTSSITTPTQDDQAFGNIASISDGNVGDGKDKRPPIVSTFSTSSKDLNPYPHHLLPAQTRQTPPQVVHYGSQTNTPTVLSPAGSAEVRPTSSMSKEESIDDGKSAKHEEQGS
ncbi:HOG (high osmolarity glycerol) pathway protein [Loxospora ochrophaea]|nr:HOG (high osmolarity glycerol) pathway protein [Loxospora ochrophaea]